MKNNIGILLATLVVCATYTIVEFMKLEQGRDLIVSGVEDGVFVINKKTGNVTFCYKGGRDAEIWPVCKEGARVTNH